MLQTKVSQLQLPAVVDQEILRFEVSVKDFTSMTVVQTSQQLKQEQLKWKKNTQVNNKNTVYDCDVEQNGYEKQKMKDICQRCLTLTLCI